MVLYPRPTHREVTVRRDESVEPAGRLNRARSFIADIEAAAEALASSIADGLFLADKETEFDYVEHYDSLDAWRECLNKPKVGELVADERRIQSACSLMSEGRGEILVSARDRAARLRRLG